MRETITDALATGAFLLSPHPVQQPAIAEPIPAQIELAADQTAAPDPETMDSRLASPAEYNLAVIEAFDPNTITFWIETGLGSVGLAGATGFVTSHKLKKSLRRKHEDDIKASGRQAQYKLQTALDAAREHTDGLKDDDIPALRELVREHAPTCDKLEPALAATDDELRAEHRRWFPLMGRLAEAENTKFILATTKKADKIAATIRKEVDQVKTDITEIGANLERADTSVADAHSDLAALTNRGWDVSSYQRQAAALAGTAANARQKYAENYISEPTRIAKDTAKAAQALRKAAAALEPRREAVDKLYATQPMQVKSASATAASVRATLAKLGDTYHPNCMAGFTHLSDKLTDVLAELHEAHETGGTLIGAAGLSVEAVDRSEELRKTFSAAVAEISGMQQKILDHEEYLAKLAVKLPRKINKLRAGFTRALELVEDPDVEADTADEITSFTDDVANLSAAIAATDGQKPDYLDVEKRHKELAAEISRVQAAASQQKQEMVTLRTDIPQLTGSYNEIAQALKKFARRHDNDLFMSTVDAINKLPSSVAFNLETDRQGLRAQHEKLKRITKNAHSLLRTAKGEAGTDSDLEEVLKIVGGITLIGLGLDWFS